MWKEVIVIVITIDHGWFEIPVQHLHGMGEENNGRLSIVLSWLRLKLGGSMIQV
jgi:hypothetical protein